MLKLDTIKERKKHVFERIEKIVYFAIITIFVGLVGYLSVNCYLMAECCTVP